MEYVAQTQQVRYGQYADTLQIDEHDNKCLHVPYATQLHDIL